MYGSGARTCIQRQSNGLPNRCARNCTPGGQTQSRARRCDLSHHRSAFCGRFRVSPPNPEPPRPGTGGSVWGAVPLSGTGSYGPGIVTCGLHRWRPRWTSNDPFNPCPTGGMNYHCHIRGPVSPYIHYHTHGSGTRTYMWSRPSGRRLV